MRLCIFWRRTLLYRHHIPAQIMMTLTSTISRSKRGRTTTRVPFLMMLALFSAGILVLSNLPSVPARFHTYLSSLPLALAGIAYAILQFQKRPSYVTLLKRLLLAATFIIWAIDQLLDSGKLATLIGDIVIAAYVLDLYWLIQEQISAVNSPSDGGDRSS
jgi:hypothetical protein